MTGDKITCQNKLGVAGEEGAFHIRRTKGRTYFLRVERIHSIIARLNRRPKDFKFWDLASEEEIDFQSKTLSSRI